MRTLIDGVEANASSFMEYRVDANNPIPLIYQSGYLTIKGYDKRFGNYLLNFPMMKYDMDLWIFGSLLHISGR